MKLWLVTLSVSYLNADGIENRVIEADTGGQALDRAVSELHVLRAGGLICWRCTHVAPVTPRVTDK